MRFRHGRKIPDLRFFGLLLNQLQQSGAVGTAVPHVDALLRGQAAPRRAEDPGAIRRHQPQRHLPRGFQQLRGQQSIQSARHRVQAEHRALSLQRVQGRGPHFHVIGGGPGALRHARDGRALRGKSGAACSVHQPTAEHTAAFTAQGADQQTDGRVHARCKARTMRCCTAAHRRSSGLGFCTISAR